MPTFNGKGKKKSKCFGDDEFINDGPIVVGESVRRKDTSDERREREREQEKQRELEKKKKRKPPEAQSFEELMKLAQVNPILGKG